MINRNSRYARDSVLQRVAVSGKDPQQAVYQDPAVYSNQVYQTVISQIGDSFESFAFTYYQDPTSWWVIARANPQVFFPSAIPPGTTIRIPSL